MSNAKSEGARGLNCCLATSRVRIAAHGFANGNSLILLVQPHFPADMQIGCQFLFVHTNSAADGLVSRPIKYPETRRPAVPTLPPYPALHLDRTFIKAATGFLSARDKQGLPPYSPLHQKQHHQHLRLSYTAPHSLISPHRFNAPHQPTTSVTMSDFFNSTDLDKFLAEWESEFHATDMGFVDLLNPIGYDGGHVDGGGPGPAPPLDP